jgi:hypothetical protein
MMHMKRRAFLAIQCQNNRQTMNCWGTTDLPWPTPHDAIQDAADAVAKLNGSIMTNMSTIITSLAWLSDPE